RARTKRGEPAGPCGGATARSSLARVRGARARIRSTSMEQALAGDLGSFEVPDLLTLLHHGQRSGVLALERADQETKLYLRKGSPVFAATTREDLRLVQVLVGAEQITEGELASFLKVQVSEVIFETFGWSGGVFTFWERIPAPP